MTQAITTVTTPASRRAALRWGGMAAIVGAVGLPAGAVPVQSDAELIAACAEHIENMDRFNLSTGDISDPDVSALWAAYTSTMNVIEEAQPKTIAGAMALARAALAEARTVPRCWDIETVDFDSNSMAGAWAGRAIWHLTRLSGDLPDAELLTLCQRFDGLQRQIMDLFDDEDSMDDEVRERIIAGIDRQQAPILERMMAIKATTPAGITARVRTLAMWAPDAMENDGPDCMWNERMLAALLRDLMAMVGAKV